MMVRYVDGSMIGMVVGGFITAAAGLLAALVEDKKHLRRVAWATLAGGVVVVACSFWSGINQAASSAKIEELSQTIAQSITGGDSFCYVQLWKLDKDSDGDIRIVALQHEGKFPLYDVSVAITDLDRFEEMKKQGQRMAWEDVVQKTQRVYSFGNLAPTASSTLGAIWRLPKTDSARLNIVISARNGFFSQLLRLRRINGTWQQACRVNTAGHADAGKILYEKIDAGFPRNTNDSVDW